MSTVAPSASLAVAQAGMIGLCGASGASGVSVVVTNLWQLRHARGGVAVAFVIRGALARPTFEAACAFVQSVPHASGQTYTLSHAASGRVASFECCAAGTVPLPLAPLVVDAAPAAAGAATVGGGALPLPQLQLLCQTNHPKSVGASCRGARGVAGEVRDWSGRSLWR